MYLVLITHMSTLLCLVNLCVCSTAIVLFLRTGDGKQRKKLIKFLITYSLHVLKYSISCTRIEDLVIASILFSL